MIIRKASGIISLVSSSSVLYFHFAGMLHAFDSIMTVLASILLLVSVLCVLEFYYAFYGSAAISIILFAFKFLDGNAGTYSIAILLLLLVSALFSIVSIRRSSKLPEQTHPLNLPVFG